MMMRQSWIGLCIVVLSFVCVVSALDKCIEERDLKGYYLACREDNTRDMIWYWDDRECDSSGLPTRPRVENLPCDIRCPAGQFLPYGKTECESCTAGTYSMGGGTRFSSFDKWPREKSVILRSWCSRPAGYIASEHPNDGPLCDGWRLREYYMDSGDLKGVHNVYSVLVASFVITENDGYLKFRYALDSQLHSDGLWIQVDNEAPRHMANTAEYKEVTIYFSSGLHFVSWVYYKDASESTGEDAAKINLVEIYGLRKADDECTKCSPGYYADSIEEDECLICPFNTYSNTFGSTSCTNCPNDKYALKGATECEDRTDPCDADDFTFRYTECTESNGQWTRNKVASWVEPKFCLEDGSTPLPPTEYGLACGVCKPGFQTVGQQGECQPCPAGFYSDGEHACQPCAAGSAAVPQAFFNTWDEWDSRFTTDCNGDDCTNEGWELASGLIHSGRYPGKRVDVWLQFEADVETEGGSVEFTFRLFGGSRFSYFQFLMDGYYGALYRETIDTWTTVSFPLSPGKHQLVWNFHRLDNSDEYPEAKAQIQSIIISGVRGGGASQCVPCASGFYQPSTQQDTCLACAPGNFTNEKGQTKCTSCPSNTFANKPGSSSCVECGIGSSPNDDHSDCDVTCIFEDSKGNTYNIAPLNTGVHYIGSQRHNNSYFMVNFCDRVPAKRCDDKSPYVCEARTITNNLNEKFEFKFDSGNFFEFHEAPAGSGYSFELRYTNGSYEECAGGLLRSTVVQFACNSETGESTWSHEMDSTGCANKFFVRSPFACRLCTKNDYEHKKGDCENGKRQITFIKNKNAVCVSSPQAPVEEDCGDVELGLGLVVIVAVAVFVVIMILVAVIVFIVHKKNQIEIKYSQLKATNGDSGVHVEMETTSNTVGDQQA